MEDKREVKLYKEWPGNNHFYCNGRIIMGPDNIKAFVTSFLIIGPGAVFIASPSVYFLLNNANPAPLVIEALLLICSQYFMYCTACTEPGYLLKQTNGIAKGPINAPIITEDYEKDNRTFNFVYGNTIRRVKYCPTCHIWRPPRTSHCPSCQHCVQKFDHHCPWIGNCVGKRNYRYFLSFLMFTFLMIIWTWAFSIAQIVIMSSDIKDEEDVSATTAFAMALEECTPAFVLSIICVPGFVFVGGLFSYHMFLCTHNLTTYEHRKSLVPTVMGNPFTRGIWKNILSIFSTPLPQTHFDSSQKIERSSQDVILSCFSKEAVIPHKRHKIKNVSLENGHIHEKARKSNSGTLSPSDIGTLQLEGGQSELDV